MRRFKLTKTTVDVAMRDPEPRIVWDQEITGFGLRVRPAASGRLRGVFLFRYFSPSSKADRWLTLGEFGRPYTADDARAWAKARLRLVDDGGDPAVNTGEAIPTLSGYVDRYLRLKKTRKKPDPPKDSTLRVDRGNLDRIVKEHPKIAGKRLDLITQEDIEAIVNRKDHRVTGNRWLAVLRHLFNVAAGDRGEGWSLANAKGWAGPDASGRESRWTNPCENVSRYTEKARNESLADDEWPKLFGLLDRYAKESPFITALIRLQALTGARGSELREARWEWLQVDETPSAKPKSKPVRTGTLTLPTSKEGGEKTIILPAAAVAVLDALPRIKGCHFVFPGLTVKAPVDISTVMHWWARHRAKAGLDRIRLHDLRHSMAAVLIGGGASLAEVGELFGHKSEATTKRYASLADRLKKKRAGDAAARIAAMSKAQGDPANAA